MKDSQKCQHYRDYKRFDNENFRKSLITCFSTGKNISCDAFENLVLQTLDKMAPIKQKHVRDNQMHIPLIIQLPTLPLGKFE